MDIQFLITCLFFMYVSVSIPALIVWWRFSSNQSGSLIHSSISTGSAAMVMEPASEYIVKHSQSLQDKECRFYYEQWHSVSCLRNLQRSFQQLRESGNSKDKQQRFLDEITPIIRSFNLKLASLHDKYEPNKES